MKYKTHKNPQTPKTRGRAMGWLTLKLFYGTTDNYSEETRYMWTLAEVREYAQMVFDLNNQEFALHLKVVAAPAAPLAPESDDEMEVEEDDEEASVVVGGVVGGVVVVGIRI